MEWPGDNASQAWQTLFENHPDAILVLDRDGYCVDANPVACRLTGLDRKQIRGRELATLIPPEEQPRIAAALNAAAQGETPSVAHALATGGNGTLAMETTLLPVEKGKIEGFFAISRLSRPAASEAEQRYHSLFTHHPDATYSIDLEGYYTEANEPALELAGLSLEEVIGRHYSEFVAEEQRARVEAAFTRLLEGRPVDMETIALKGDGSRFPAHVTAIPIIVGGKVTGIHGITHNISERRHAEYTARELASRLTNTLESITDAFFTVDRDWRYTYVNGEAENLMRYPREELLGRKVWEMFPDLIDTSVETNYRLAMEKRRTVHFEYFFPPYQRWFDIHTYPTEEGLAVYFRDITQRKLNEAEIEFLAMYDPLTHLPNRRLMADRLDQAVRTAPRNRHYGAVLFMDLDNFKVLNDTIGHHGGDILLQQTARRLREWVDAEDTVARFGGDEFLVIAENLGKSEAAARKRALALGEKLIKHLARPFDLDGTEAFSGASIGMAVFGKRKDKPEDILRRADIALHQAKTAGRHRILAFDPQMQASIDSLAGLETDLRYALQERQIQPWYQPQYNREGRLTGAEALARWQHPQRGTVSPDEFIVLAEDTGLIMPLGRLILESVCEHLAAWSTRPLPDGFRMAVNISAREFHDPDFVTQVLDILRATNTDPHLLQLELTESLLLEDIGDTINKMKLLQQEGISASLDDFGTGYSSLFYLKRLPLDQIKIDRGFISDLLTDTNDAAIVRAIIGLAHNMELNVIAEGVENAEVRDRLAEYGCYTYQGYYFSQPVTAEDFAGLLSAGSD